MLFVFFSDHLPYDSIFVELEVEEECIFCVVCFVGGGKVVI